MAKKRRTPPPPRVQAPQRRGGGGSTERRTRLFLYGAAAAGPIVLAIVLAVIFLGGSDGTIPSSKQFLAAGCTLKKYPLLEGIHVAALDAKVKWNSWPPTSGPHYQVPAPFNFYDQVVNPRLTLHNLEHGGIDIFHGQGVPSSEIEQLRSFWRDSPNGIVVAPMPTPDKNETIPKPVPNYTDKIVAAAWTSKPYSDSTDRKGQQGNGWLLVCPRFDEKTFKQFRDIHRGKGPERFPVSLLTPGG